LRISDNKYCLSKAIRSRAGCFFADTADVGCFFESDFPDMMDNRQFLLMIKLFILISLSPFLIIEKNVILV